MSVRQLIEIAGNQTVMQNKFHMRTAVVNNNIVYQTQGNKTTDTYQESAFAGELINYVILQNAAMSISSGQLA
jgi:hypothetical protein